jgi:D-alanine-D-alanine ligase
MHPLKVGIAFDDSSRRHPEAPPDGLESRGGIVCVVREIERALVEIGHEPVRLGVDIPIERSVAAVRAAGPDVIFNLCEGFCGRSSGEVAVAGLFELLEIPYTGSDPVALALGLNKGRTKEILSYHGVATPNHVILPDRDFAWEDDLDFPLIVKPAREDASLGITRHSVVKDLAELREQVELVTARYRQPALVEEYVNGREFNVTVIGNDPPEVMPLSEIDFSGLPRGIPRIVTHEAKWEEESDEYKGTVAVCPARVEEETAAEIATAALAAYRLIGCRDYARVDIRLSRRKKPYVLEVNPNPDLSMDAGVVRAAKARGWDHSALVKRILEMALRRKVEHDRAETGAVR